MDPDAIADADATAVSQALGFSSFGTQNRPQKKRKYFAAPDSITSAQFLPPQGPTFPLAAECNSTPQGTPTAKPPANVDEIDLENNDGQDDATTPQTLSDGNIQQKPVLPASLPARPTPGTGFVGTSPENAPCQFYKPVQKHHNKLWYKDYYDSTSNENPWERLEKAIGLETRGVWITRSSDTRVTT